ncbi:FIST signal transduction protein [Actinoplanes sp. TFC3]|uniref:FIST signal transduction protein n=1 Tax=Actinoplanes sp. TFC3 TaxID=1710355 RepID=UPI000831B9E7|nr:FIST N-terminal domain-containing protein [Actinoplanes sp. TFC3]
MQGPQGRWFGAGHSTAPDAAKAGAEAATAACSGRTPKAVFVFASPAYDLPALIEAVRAEVGLGAAVVGGSSLGELSSEGVTKGGVAITALGGDGFEISTRVAYVGGNGHREAGAEVARAMAGIDKPHTALMLICEGMSGNPHEIVRGAYSVLGAAVPLVGGLTGNGTGPRSYQFSEDRVVSGAVVGVAIGSDAAISVGISHGWHRTEPAMVITRSQGNRILELDGEPALDVLLRRRGATTSDELFSHDVRLQALGLSRRSGADIRILTSADDVQRSVSGLAAMPQGAICWLMDGQYQDILGGAADSCAQAIAGLGGAQPLGVFTFDGGGRHGILGDAGVHEELATIKTALPGVPFGGFYSLGEIARVRGSLGTHALTLVTVALA